MREDLKIIWKGSWPNGGNIPAFRWMEWRKQRKTSRVSKVIVPLILNLDTRWRWVVSPGERSPGTHWREGPMHPRPRHFGKEKISCCRWESDRGSSSLWRSPYTYSTIPVPWHSSPVKCFTLQTLLHKRHRTYTRRSNCNSVSSCCLDPTVQQDGRACVYISTLGLVSIALTKVLISSSVTNTLLYI